MYQKALGCTSIVDLHSARIALIPVVTDFRVLDSLCIDQSIRKPSRYHKLSIAVYGDRIYANKPVKISPVALDYPHKADAAQDKQDERAESREVYY